MVFALGGAEHGHITSTIRRPSFTTALNVLSELFPNTTAIKSQERLTFLCVQGEFVGRLLVLGDSKIEWLRGPFIDLFR